MEPGVIAIGASAGGLASVVELVSVLPSDFGTPLVLAIHGGPDARLAATLEQVAETGLKVLEAEDGQVLEPGCVHVVPAVRHGFFKGGVLRISDPVSDKGFRPSIDTLFISMGIEYGARGVAVVLSGTLEDGKRGAQVLHDLGGRTLVQDPDDAAFGEMPRAVIRADHPDRILPARSLGYALIDMMG